VSSQAAEVRVYEVGPRDGLQNEEAFVPTEAKIELIQALIKAGLPHIEITSFVHPRWIPALADADRVAAAFDHGNSTSTFTALVPNTRGLDRAITTGMKEVAVFMSASVTHNKRNINKTHDETYSAFEPVFESCAQAGIAVRAYVSTVWGCPYEGEVSGAVTAALSERLLAMGAYEISLGDTIGIGRPDQTRRLLDEILTRVPAEKVAMHMHDTQGRALENCAVGLDYGVRTFDASVGGLGGCPYAPGASGNLATEDLVGLLEERGIVTGVDPDALMAAARLAQNLLGRRLPSRALKAANYPLEDLSQT